MGYPQNTKALIHSRQSKPRPPALRARLNAPFELVDFQNERSKELDELMRVGKEKQVTVEAPVFSGFPEHTADLRQPNFSATNSMSCPDLAWLGRRSRRPEREGAP